MATFDQTYYCGGQIIMMAMEFFNTIDFSPMQCNISKISCQTHLKINSHFEHPVTTAGSSELSRSNDLLLCLLVR
jgi:hypothetical protein